MRKPGRALRIGGAVFCAVLAVACTRTSARRAPVVEPVALPAFSDARPVAFEKVVVRLLRGTRLGYVQLGLACVDYEPIEWKGGTADLADREVAAAFRDELARVGYPVSGDEAALFDTVDEDRADLRVGGIIRELDVNVCHPRSGFGNFLSVEADGYVAVDWQVYSSADQAVVLETRTEGSTRIDDRVSEPVDEVFLDAFAAATRALLADPGFRRIALTAPGTRVTGAPELAAVELANPRLRDRPVGEASTDLRRAVATVVVEGGHGSGFFVGGAGHLITNAHVVEGLHFVTVRLVTGRELVGEVLRRDPERDVALVRVEEAVPGLPVRGPEPNVGEEVYAVGAPLEKALHTTVSRGIVSAYRTDPKGQRLIQGDVNVLPGNSGGPLVDDRGNVVGLTVSGRLLDGVPSGINFFIPIHDALDRLHVTLAASEG